jgi:hypothetical protein
MSGKLMAVDNGYVKAGSVDKLWLAWVFAVAPIFFFWLPLLEYGVEQVFVLDII